MIQGCIGATSTSLVYFSAGSQLMFLRPAPLKRTSLEHMSNRHIIFLFLIVVVLSLIAAFANFLWVKANGQSHSYLDFTSEELDSPWFQFGFCFLTFFILLGGLIPISLIVTMELVKLAQALFVIADRDMYYAPTGTHAMVRTSSLMEDLGRVEYLFSDKTGTLTRNKIEFKCCSIAGTAYADPPAERSRSSTRGSLLAMSDFDEGLHSDETSHPSETFEDLMTAMISYDNPRSVVIREFLTLLAVCHTVIPETDPNDPKVMHYQASSPDENALVNAARSFGYTFKVGSRVLAANGHSLNCLLRCANPARLVWRSTAKSVHSNC